MINCKLTFDFDIQHPSGDRSGRGVPGPGRCGADIRADGGSAPIRPAGDQLGGPMVNAVCGGVKSGLGNESFMKDEEDKKWSGKSVRENG